MTDQTIDENLSKYLSEALNMSVTTLKFKNLNSFNEEFLKNVNKFHEENQKIIGVIETLLKSDNVSKYCIAANYQTLPTEAFDRCRTFSDHPKINTDSWTLPLNTSEVKEEVKKHVDSTFNENFVVPILPNIDRFKEVKEEKEVKEVKKEKKEVKKEEKEVKEVKEKKEVKEVKEVKEATPKKFNDLFNNNQPVVKKPIGKAVKTYTSLIEERETMILKPLDDDFKEFIKNSENFKDVQFYYTNPEILHEDKLYEFETPTSSFYVANNKKLYSVDPDNNLVQAESGGMLQYWKKKIIY